MATKKFNPILTFFCCLLALVIGFIAAFALYTYLKKPHGGDVYVSGDLQIHFLALIYNSPRSHIISLYRKILVSKKSPRIYHHYAYISITCFLQLFVAIYVQYSHCVV